MISNIHRNIMGTISFAAQFPGMRKPQEFIVYPIHPGADASRLTVQSDTRMGSINCETGDVRMSAPRPGGAYGMHIPGASSTPTCKLSGEHLLQLKAQVFATAHGKAGSNGIVYTDNSGALDVFKA